MSHLYSGTLPTLQHTIILPARGNVNIVCNRGYRCIAMSKLKSWLKTLETWEMMIWEKQKPETEIREGERSWVQYVDNLFPLSLLLSRHERLFISHRKGVSIMIDDIVRHCDLDFTSELIFDNQEKCKCHIVFPLSLCPVLWIMKEKNACIFVILLVFLWFSARFAHLWAVKPYDNNFAILKQSI